MHRLYWLTALWPLALVPLLHDPTPVPAGGTIVPVADTTYGDGRWVALVPGVTDTLTHGGDTVIRFIPDPDSVGTGVAYRAVRRPGGDSFLVISYQTLPAEAQDSAAVDSIWSAWGLGSPYAYAVSVPLKSLAHCDTCSITDTTLALWHWNADKYTSDSALLADVGGNSEIADQSAAWIYWTEISPTYCKVLGENWASGDNCPIYLDGSSAYGPFAKSVRYDWNYYTLGAYPDSLNPDESRSVTLKHMIPSPTYGGDTIKEIWVEVSIRTTEGFSGCSDGATVCDHKVLFVDTQRGGSTGESSYGRTAVHLWGSAGNTAPTTWTWYWTGAVGEDGTAKTGTTGHLGDAGICDTNVPEMSTAAQTWNDGEWHRIRWYQNLGSVQDTNPSLSSLDGRVVIWYDDARVVDTDSLIALGLGSGGCQRFAAANWVDNGYVRFRQFTLGANKDHGGYHDIVTRAVGIQNPTTESWWTGHITLFTADPGWPKYGD